VETVQWLPEDCAYVRQVRKTGPESKVPGQRNKTRRSKGIRLGTRDSGPAT
jgi:hypothetical protein